MRRIEKAEAIRKELKELGYNSRIVSVRSDNNSINITLKKLIPIKPIEEICRKYEKVDRCERTYEILSGGNTFVFVNYDWEMLNKETEARKEIAQKIREKITSSRYYENIASNDKIVVKYDGEDVITRLVEEDKNGVIMPCDRQRSACVYSLASTLARVEAEYGKLNY